MTPVIRFVNLAKDEIARGRSLEGAVLEVRRQHSGLALQVLYILGHHPAPDRAVAELQRHAREGIDA